MTNGKTTFCFCPSTSEKECDKIRPALKITGSILMLGVALLTLALPGCSDSGMDVVPVEGTVTWNGEPVPNIVVEFMPTQGNRPSQGFTDENGHFKLNYTIDEEGAEVGTHDVTFAWVADKQGQEPSEAVQEILKLHGAEAVQKNLKLHGEDGTPIQVEITEPTENLELALPRE